MRIELRIGRIVLEGIEPRDAKTVRTALTTELAALLTRSPITPPASHHIRRTTAPPFPAAPDATALGRGIARAVHGSLGMPMGGDR
ncbi:hypothetical protein AB0J57_33525 [Streptomyces sp. NPDC049837]|uniref:hypothetical protein n=1 Tax=Streptomyces sp. NPDC049837 TaxID=3155277 RepID=UPI00343FEECA